MAQSRLEKIGTIYTRITSLLKCGAMKEEDKPIWYALYEVFPPKYEPRYDRPVPKTQIREILYKEDVVRAKFHKNQKSLGVYNFQSKEKSQCQRFLLIYQQMEKIGVPSSELYSKAMETYLENSSIPRTRQRDIPSNTDSKEEQKQNIKIDLDSIFNEKGSLGDSKTSSNYD